jgi:hypothetical protein
MGRSAVLRGPAHDRDGKLRKTAAEGRYAIARNPSLTAPAPKNGLYLAWPKASSRALRFERAVLAGIRPLTAQHLTVFLIGEVMRRPFTGRAAIVILRRNIDEVLLAKTTGGFGT